MDIKIRNSKEKDYKEIVNVINSQIKREERFFDKKEYQLNFPKETEDSLRDVKKVRSYFVVEENGKIIAFASYYIKENNILWLSEIVVLPKKQNRGVASELLRYIEDKAKSKNIKAVALETQKVFDWAIGFYKKQEYTILNLKDLNRYPFKGTLIKKPLKNTYIFGKIL
jgi:N-acetylglutamate synthase-like GNAT family acetyltransferase